MKGEVKMLKKKDYITAEIEIAMISHLDVITASGVGSLGKEDWDDDGWTSIKEA